MGRFTNQEQTVVHGLDYRSLYPGGRGDAAFVPIIASAVSLTILLLQVLWEKHRMASGQEEKPLAGNQGDRLQEPASRDATAPSTLAAQDDNLCRTPRSPSKLYYELARVAAVATSFAISLVPIISQEDSANSSTNYFFQAALALSCGYALVLALGPLTSREFGDVVVRHCNINLLASWATLLYRDIWPLATFDSLPQDSLDALFWLQFGLLSLSSVFIPLLIPRRYVPIDPKKPQPIINPEQTASIASLLTFSFLDHVVVNATKSEHFSDDELPELPDYDDAAHLRTFGIPRLDPFQGAQQRHVAFNMLWLFRREFLVMAAALITQSIATFIPPYALSGLLRYFEDNSHPTLSPWIWIVGMSAGPLLVSLSLQWYSYYATTILYRAEALLVELVFEHSLRTRLKAEGDSSNHDGPTGTKPISGPLVGKINTLITVDVANIGEAKDFLILVLQVPLNFSISLLFLYHILGWCTFIGVFGVILLMPIPGYLTNWNASIQAKKLTKTEARVQTVSEMMSSLRMVKLFGWESKMSELLQQKRDEELHWIWKEKLAFAALIMTNVLIPDVTMLLSYASYVVLMKQPLTVSKTLASMIAFDILRVSLHTTSQTLARCTRGKASLDRIHTFLNNTALLDRYDQEAEAAQQEALLRPANDEIGFHDAVFSWSKEDVVDSPRRFCLRVEGPLLFRRNAVNVIIGQTGSGKTAILMALLGEMHFVLPSAESWYNLPRAGGIAYAAQETWVQNNTIRENILYGSLYDEERYKKVVFQCALERDLELFEAGDSTEVGEKGITLSGGQKARITLARAVYSSAQILLLDDILAALDVHTSAWIVNECLQGDLVKGRTVILVTHNITLVEPIATLVVVVDATGRVKALENDISTIKEEFSMVSDSVGRSSEVIEFGGDQKVLLGDNLLQREVAKGKLVFKEEVAKGRVSWSALQLFLRNLSTVPTAYLMSWIFLLIVFQALIAWSMWFMIQWTSQYETHEPEDVQVSWWLIHYCIIVDTSILLFGILTAYFYAGSLRASRIVNQKLVDSVLHSTFRWLDETPVARVLARCTQDIASVDANLPAAFEAVVSLAVQLMVRIAGPAILDPVVIIPSTLVLLLGGALGRLYMKAQMPIRREQSLAKAPVLSHFAAAITGLVSIRAYGTAASVQDESIEKINRYMRLSKTSHNLERWVAIRTDALGASFTAVLATYLLLKKDASAGSVGFSLLMVLGFCSRILQWVRNWNDFEIQANSLERIQACLEIPHEQEPTSEGLPPAAWPTSGQLSVKGLSARYSHNGPTVLHSLSFDVHPGERIGIVGRTGSGKSSLTLALLRCILTEGNIYYDGLDTSKLNLDALRSSITIIPQNPELLTGTLRYNLDPFGQHDDKTMNDALRSAGLFALQDADAQEGAKFTLDSTISSGGGNLSVGQRQIIALARAIVRDSKLLILDEATSSIDHKTDVIIQATLRNELPSNATILIVAHRLHTIMDADRVMVLDAGRIVEFDSPTALLMSQSGGVFKSMVDGGSDCHVLYGLAGILPEDVSL